MRRATAFHRLVAATAVSDTANGVFALAAGVAAALASRSTLVVGLVTVAASLPWLVTAAPAGVVVDRFGPVTAIVVANTGRAIAMGLTAAVIFWSVAVPVLVPVLVFVVATFQTVVDSAAEVATADLVEEASRTSANGLIAMVTRIFYQFLGPALAGILIQINPALPGALAGIACLLSVVLVARLPRPAVRSQQAPPSSGALAGIRLVLSRPVLAGLVAVGGLTTIANGVFYTVLVIYALSQGPLGLNAAQYGLVIGLTGVGAACGALTTARAERRLGRNAVLVLTRVGWGLVFAAPLVGRHVVLVVLMFVGSWLGGMWSVQALSIRQSIVPRDQLGRVSGASRMLTYGMTPVGALLGGFVGLGVSPTLTFALCTVLTLLTILPIRRFLSDSAIADAVPPRTASVAKEVR